MTVSHTRRILARHTRCRSDQLAHALCGPVPRRRLPTLTWESLWVARRFSAPPQQAKSGLVGDPGAAIESPQIRTALAAEGRHPNQSLLVKHSRNLRG